MSRFAILFTSLVFAMGIPYLTSNVLADCAKNSDWPDAQCFDMFPVSRDEYRKAWAPYYDYKGPEWMEAKKAALLQAIREGNFPEWADATENSNVYHYYHSIGVVPNQYGHFSFDSESVPSVCGDDAFLLEGVCVPINPQKSPSDGEVFSFQAYLLTVFSFIAGLPAIGALYWLKRRRSRNIVLAALVFASVLLLAGFFLGIMPNAIA